MVNYLCSTFSNDKTTNASLWRNLIQYFFVVFSLELLFNMSLYFDIHLYY